MDDLLIEVRSMDAGLVEAAANEVGLPLQPEGEIRALDGATLAAFAIAVAPGSISLLEFVLTRLLEKKRPVMFRTPKVTIRAETIEDLERAMDLYRQLAEQPDAD